MHYIDWIITTGPLVVVLSLAIYSGSYVCEVADYLAAGRVLLETISRPFHPFVVWEMNPVKFPINSYELYFLAMISGILAYVAGSLLSQRNLFNRERLLHRGIYDVAHEDIPRFKWTLRNATGRLIGITPEYTMGDKIIAWSVFGYAIVYKFGLSFVGVLIWNLISPWPIEWWSIYFFITSLVVTGILGVILTFWFLIGGVIDLRRLFVDPAARKDDLLDNGMVEGHVSLVDKAIFEARTGHKQDQLITF